MPTFRKLQPNQLLVTDALVQLVIYDRKHVPTERLGVLRYCGLLLMPSSLIPEAEEGGESDVSA
jgi:hypothetical protein